jgi:quercetin dioxygenase-like cupin family protein
VTAALFERAPLLLERLELAAGERCGWREHDAGESFLYVADGDGALELPDQEHELGRETVVWFEAGDRYRLAAGRTGLAVLVATVEGGGGE